MRELAEKKHKWGAAMLHGVLRREKLVVNHKRTERIYREERLTLRRKRRRKKTVAMKRGLRELATSPHQRWAMDFVADALWCGRKVRAFTIIDTFTKVCLTIYIDISIGGIRVCQILDQLIERYGVPQEITVDNGPEFISKALDEWAYRNGVLLDFIDPGKPTQNCFIESFNGTFRDECLNENYFTSLKDMRMIVGEWREEYNTFRPHSSLKYMTPQEFMEKQLTRSKAA